MIDLIWQIYGSTREIKIISTLKICDQLNIIFENIKRISQSIPNFLENWDTQFSPLPFEPWRVVFFSFVSFKRNYIREAHTCAMKLNQPHQIYVIIMRSSNHFFTSFIEKWQKTHQKSFFKSMIYLVIVIIASPQVYHGKV